MPARFLGIWNPSGAWPADATPSNNSFSGFPLGSPWQRNRTQLPSGFFVVDVCGDTTHEQSFFQIAGGACGVGGAIRLYRRGRLLDLLGDDRLAGAADARLVLAAYLRWGTEGFSRLEGDFAFALWDRSDSKLFLVRDPFAVRRIHYAEDGGNVVFSSEVEGVLAWPTVDREIDNVTVLDTLLGRYQTRTRTFYRAVKRVFPGHFAYFGNGGYGEVRYVTPPPPSLRLKSLGDYADAFRQEFSNSVEERLPRLGPVLCHLSGGLDSTSIAATAASVLRRLGRADDLTLANARFPRLACDEGEIAEGLARKLGQSLIEWDGTSPEVSDLEEPRKAWPFGRSSMAGSIQGDLDIANQRGISTILSGLGGNQLTEEWDYEADAFREMGPLGLIRALATNMTKMSARRRLQYARRCVSWARDGFNPARTRRRQILQGDPILRAPPPWLDPSMFGAWRTLKDETAYRGEAQPESGSWMRELVWSATTQDPRNVWTMEHEDARAAERGVEFRYPFLSWTLLSLVMSVPWRMRTPMPYRRVLHREAMRGILPDDVRMRQTFVAFSEANLLNAQRSEEIMRRILGNSEWACGHLVKRKPVLEMLETWSTKKHESHTFEAGEAWRFLRDVAALEAWLRRLSC